jgi:hypothetical protein
MSHGSIDTAFAGVSSRPYRRPISIYAKRGDCEFLLFANGRVETEGADRITRENAAICAGRIASGLAWARLYLANEGYAVETIYE